jgi:hypothetical protein
VKYSEIQGNLLKKLRYDLDAQLSKSDHLRNQNKKLFMKVEQLTEKIRAL